MGVMAFDADDIEAWLEQTPVVAQHAKSGNGGIGIRSGIPRPVIAQPIITAPGEAPFAVF